MPKEPIVSFKYIQKDEEPVENVLGTLYFMDASAIYIGIENERPRCIFKGSSYMPYDSSAFLWRQGTGTNSVTQVSGAAKALGENSIIAANDGTGKTYTNVYTLTDKNPSTGVYNITPDPTDDLKIGDIVKISSRGGNTYFAKILSVLRLPVLDGSPTYIIYLDGFTSSVAGAKALLTKVANIVYGACSGFFGNGNVVAGTTSYVLGLDLTALNNGEFAVGVLNKSNVTHKNNPGAHTRFSVGIGDYIENNGDSSVPRNALEIMRNGDIYVYGAGDYDGTTTMSSSTLQDLLNKEVEQIDMISVTYDGLVDLVDSSSLVPGMQYRITDYACTTTQVDTSSANHTFDIIVTADSVRTLNENAKAALHAGDSYFLYCNLNSWELKYTLDNDTARFAWADDTNGKGVIYYMKDEWNNECPYDFKNILFKRWAITMDQDHPSLVVDSQDNNYGFYYGAKSLTGNNVLSSATYGNDFGWFYTFALKDLATGDWYDYTVITHMGLLTEEGNEIACYDNHIEAATDEYSSGSGEMAKMLNNIVFFNCYTDMSDTSYAEDYSYCNNNRFQGNCYSNTFGNDCNGNTFGNDCYSNTFGNGCSGNTFMNYCSGNTLVNNCCNNMFGNSCGNNTFGNGCSGNTFMNYCSGNTFMNYCNGNTFGNDCYRNTFGNNCRQLTVFDGVQNCSVTGGSLSGSTIKNAQILNGTAGTSPSNKLTISFEANKSYIQIAGLNSSGILKIWTPADLID